MPGTDDTLERLQARVTAMTALLDSLLSSLVTKSLLNREHVAGISRQAESVLRQSENFALALDEFRRLQDAMPTVQAATGARSNPSGGGTRR